MTTPWMTIKGEYGTAVLTEQGESLMVTLSSPGHATTSERHANSWSRSYVVAQAASAAAHGPDAELCTEGPLELCPHVVIECERIDAYDLGLTDDPGCWIQKVKTRERGK